MKKEIISHALGEIDARYVAEAAEYAPPTARFARVRRAAAAAACLVLLAGAVLLLNRFDWIGRKKAEPDAR